MPMYRKKPVTIEAIPWDGTVYHANDIIKWMGDGFLIGPDSDLAIEIPTLEGIMKANPGDWIIRGVQGEFYPCKPDIFAATYEEVH